MPTVNNWFERLLENYIYAMPDPPPRKRTKPMEVLCVGMPRTGTESLQHALLRLGYDHTFHGWDIIFEEPNYSQQWVRLCRKKWFGPLDGNTTFTADDFDPLIGHALAVTDAAGSVFAAELIGAYPDAKVVLNRRKDRDEWHRSVQSTILQVNDKWFLWFLSLFSRECFWAWRVYVYYMWPGLFRALDGDITTGMARNGKWVYQEHYNMVRGLVPKDRLLEWTVEDGWEPLCAFLGKPVPEEPFPHANAVAGWPGQEAKVGKRFAKEAVQNVMKLGGVVVIAWVAYRYLTRS